MAVKYPLIFPIRDANDIIVARQEGKTLARELGFGLVDRTAVEIIIAELGTNVVRYAEGRGSIQMQPASGDGSRGIEIVCRDQGPGIEELASVLGGDVESALGLGIGLAAVRRFSDDFEITSAKDTGTEVRARKFPRMHPRHVALASSSASRGRFSVEEHVFKGDVVTVRIAVVTRPARGAAVNGDAYFAEDLGDRVVFGLIDGLGHGEEAAKAAVTAVSCTQGAQGATLRQIMSTCHRDLRPTRGAVMGLVSLDRAARLITYAGVGNIEARVISGEERKHLVSINGIVGHQFRKYREIEVPVDIGDLILMHSDGISSKFSVTEDEKRSGDVVEIAGRIAAKYARDHDDATVLLARVEG